MHARVASGGSKQKATIPMRGSRSRSCQHWPNSLGLFAYCNQAILRGSIRLSDVYSAMGLVAGMHQTKAAISRMFKLSKTPLPVRL